MADLLTSKSGTGRELSANISQDADHLLSTRKSGDFTCPASGEKLTYGKPWGLTKRRRRENGSVYFIGGEVGHIKIGWSSYGGEQRCKDLQCGSPIQLKVLAEVKGSMKLELQYHRRFAAIRAHGEWFERTPELLAEIERLTVIS